METIKLLKIIFLVSPLISPHPLSSSLSLAKPILKFLFHIAEAATRQDLSLKEDFWLLC